MPRGHPFPLYSATMKADRNKEEGYRRMLLRVGASDPLADIDEADPHRCFLEKLLAAARAADQPGLYVHYWFSSTVRAWLDESGDELGRRLRSELRDMIALGINLRGRDPAVFAAGLRQERPELPRGALGVAMYVAAALAFAGPRLEAAFRALDLFPGARAAVSFLAALSGSFYGADRLKELLEMGDDDE